MGKLHKKEAFVTINRVVEKGDNVTSVVFKLGGTDLDLLTGMIDQQCDEISSDMSCLDIESKADLVRLQNIRDQFNKALEVPKNDAVLIVFEDGTGEHFSNSDKFLEYLTTELGIDQEDAEMIIEEKHECYEHIVSIHWDYKGY